MFFTVFCATSADGDIDTHDQSDQQPGSMSINCIKRAPQHLVVRISPLNLLRP
jgi:hypothetical protein